MYMSYACKLISLCFGVVAKLNIVLAGDLHVCTNRRWCSAWTFLSAINGCGKMRCLTTGFYFLNCFLLLSCMISLGNGVTAKKQALSPYFLFQKISPVRFEWTMIMSRYLACQCRYLCMHICVPQGRFRNRCSAALLPNRMFNSVASVWIQLWKINISISKNRTCATNREHFLYTELTSPRLPTRPPKNVCGALILKTLCLIHDYCVQLLAEQYAGTYRAIFCML